MKAVLYAHGARIVLGHSVHDLARQCEVHDESFAGVAEDALLLDQFYIPTRYPSGLPPPAVPSEAFLESQAESAQQAAERIAHAVEIHLGTQTDVMS